MPRRTLLLFALVAAVLFFVFVIPTRTAPVPLKKPVREFTNSFGMSLVRIAAGKFMMGSPPEEKGRYIDERPHEVEIAKAFYLGVYPVTQAAYKEVMGSNPSCFSTDGVGKDKVMGLDTSQFPVEMVTWEEAKTFCEKLTALAKEKEAGSVYRLPTEAEWEYACRAGTKTRYYTGNCEEEITKAAWYDGNSDGRTHAVGKKKPNGWGLYDMQGNVYQWCSDWYDEEYYKKSPIKAPEGPEKGERRVLRGGSWHGCASNCRPANRYYNAPGKRHFIIGFRVVCIPSRK